MTLIMCTAENPGMSGDFYHMPYVEAVDGYRHGYMTDKGFVWTLKLIHPDDARCPGCEELRAKR